jgi:hypothetical protein
MLDSQIAPLLQQKGTTLTLQFYTVVCRVKYSMPNYAKTDTDLTCLDLIPAFHKMLNDVKDSRPSDCHVYLLAG